MSDLKLARAECLHILRNPYGHSAEHIREARLFATEELERLSALADREKLQRADALLRESLSCLFTNFGHSRELRERIERHLEGRE